MSATNDGGPAFPCMVFSGDTNNDPEYVTGMSLRDWFASNEDLAEWDPPDAVASRAMCDALAGRPPPPKGWSSTGDGMLDMLRWEADWRAALKYVRADALLAARKGGEE